MTDPAPERSTPMSNSDVVSVAALIVSLIAGGIATWIGYYVSQRELVATTYATATSMVLEIDRLLVGYPEFRPYLYEGKRLNDADPERDKLLAAGTMVLDIAEYIWERRQEMHKEEDRYAWRDWLISLFHTSPILADLYARQTEFYPNLTALQRGATTEARTGPHRDRS